MKAKKIVIAILVVALATTPSVAKSKFEIFLDVLEGIKNSLDIYKYFEDKNSAISVNEKNIDIFIKNFCKGEVKNKDDINTDNCDVDNISEDQLMAYQKFIDSLLRAKQEKNTARILDEIDEKTRRVYDKYRRKNWASL